MCYFRSFFFFIVCVFFALNRKENLKFTVLPLFFSRDFLSSFSIIAPYLFSGAFPVKKVYIKNRREMKNERERNLNGRSLEKKISLYSWKISPTFMGKNCSIFLLFLFILFFSDCFTYNLWSCAHHAFFFLFCLIFVSFYSVTFLSCNQVVMPFFAIFVNFFQTLFNSNCRKKTHWKICILFYFKKVLDFCFILHTLSSKNNLDSKLFNKSLWNSI